MDDSVLICDEVYDFEHSALTEQLTCCGILKQLFVDTTIQFYNGANLNVTWQVAIATTSRSSVAHTSIVPFMRILSNSFSLVSDSSLGKMNII